MPIEITFEHFFKPEVRNAGAELIDKGTVFLQRGSDTQVDASIRSSGMPVRVSFRSASIASLDFLVNCTCPSAKKGQFCKHIWATLLLTTEKNPDFLESKKSISKANESMIQSDSPAKIDYKKKQAEYRKDRYQVQKLRLKNLKGKRAAVAVLPGEVQEAVKYFEVNGFLMSPPFDQEAIAQAKRILSKVFHPDKGGTSEEIIELLRQAEILERNS